MQNEMTARTTSMTASTIRDAASAGSAPPKAQGSVTASARTWLRTNSRDHEEWEKLRRREADPNRRLPRPTTLGHRR